MLRPFTNCILRKLSGSSCLWMIQRQCLPAIRLGERPGTPLTPPGTAIKETIGGNPNLQPETAYEWTYGVVWTPAKLIKGLTLSADFYHIDLRNAIVNRDANNILGINFGSSTGTLPNGAPTGGIFSDLIQRDPRYRSGPERKFCAFRTRTGSSPKVSITGLAINWTPRSLATATSGHSRSPSMATTWLDM